MRGLMTAVAIALIACLGLAALLLVASGRSFVYSPGVGSNVRLASFLPWSIAMLVAGAGAGVLLHAAARTFPRKYYQLMWWRDAAWLAGLIAALAATLIYVGALLTYGAR
jgi:hypothetical protein